MRRRSARDRRKRIGVLERLEAKLPLAEDLCEVVELVEHETAPALQHDSTGANYLEASPFAISSGTAKTVEESLATHRAGTRSVPIFHSRPSAKQKIFLDFNGHRVTGTGWNENNDGRMIEAPAYDVGGDDHVFDPSEQQSIERIWARVAEDFAPFDIDVTTESPPAASFRRGSEAIRVIISSNIDQRTGNRWFDGSGGVAYMGSWQWKTDTPVWVFENNLGGDEKRIAEAISHEVGHALGLDHDGGSEEDYFKGFGDREHGWAPIMGAAYNKPVTQWSRGDYVGASNTEDDLDIITSPENGVRFVQDDHASLFGFATRLEHKSLSQVFASGLISEPTDLDMFFFETNAGQIDLDVRGSEHGSNLDIQATLFNAHGNKIVTYAPPDSLAVSVTVTAPAGKYYLLVDGGGSGDGPVGYSDYGSLGWYSISGTIVPMDFLPFVELETTSSHVRDGSGVTAKRNSSRAALPTYRRPIEAAPITVLRDATFPLQLGDFHSRSRVKELLTAIDEMDLSAWMELTMNLL